MNQAVIGILALSLASASDVLLGQTSPGELLKLEATIPIGDVQGRIDHLSIDLKGQRKLPRDNNPAPAAVRPTLTYDCRFQYSPRSFFH